MSRHSRKLNQQLHKLKQASSTIEYRQLDEIISNFSTRCILVYKAFRKLCEICVHSQIFIKYI